MGNEPKRHVKVAKFRILKPAGDGMSWSQLDRLLKDARYRVFRLANLAVSEAYLGFHLWRTGRTEEYKTSTIGQLSRRLREMMLKEGVSEEQMNRFSKTGATPASIHDALSRYKIRAVTAKSKWREVIRGTSSLPTYRLNMAIPVRCDKSVMSRLERMDNGDVELDLMICLKPYPRIVLQTGDVGGSVKAILERMLDNLEQSKEGYRQRCYEIKQDQQSGKWWLYITYDFPALEQRIPDPKIIVGVDLGVSCPMYVAINNGHARMGYLQFRALGARIRSLQRQVMARRRSVQRGGRVSVSQTTARSGHGRKRKLQPIEKLTGRIEKAYSTLNHQLSAAVIDFARNHGAGVIQMEDLTTLKEVLRGTYIGMNWRYHQLQEYMKYKADEAGIELRFVDPRYTSRRCSKCGHINMEFDRAFRDRSKADGKVTRFTCSREECGFENVDPDYNAALNLATMNIEQVIIDQCHKQGIDHPALSQSTS